MISRILSKDVLATLRAKSSYVRTASNDVTPLRAILFAAMLCAAFGDLSQLVFMVLGATCYFFVQRAQLPVKKKVMKDEAGASRKHGVTPRSGRHRSVPGNTHVRPQRFSTSASKSQSSPLSCRKSTTTLMPIERPVFAGVGFEVEVVELLEQLMPTSDSEQVIHHLVDKVQQGVRHLFPHAEVFGYASGDFRHFKAFGVAVPEVEIVISIDSQELVASARGRLSGLRSVSDLDETKVQKSAIRAVTELLVSRGGFKFRRSAFRGLEPKVTMLAPVRESSTGETVPVDVSVNAVLPLHNMALIKACDSLEPRSKELILLVRRWAKDRGICHAAKGYPSPYAWSILTIYYLQVGTPEHGPLLPPMHVIAGPCGLEPPVVSFEKELDQSDLSSRPSTAELFKGFFGFYGSQFDWPNEAVSIRSGGRAKLGAAMLAEKSGMGSMIGPTIEDPSDPLKNLGGITSSSLLRMRNELVRAMELCGRNASLVEILELWAPPREELGFGTIAEL